LALQVNDLIQVLQGQESVIAELLSLADEQLQVLKNDDIEKLSEITVQQEEKGRRLALLEKKRCEILAAYSQEVGKEIHHLSELFNHIDSEDKDALQKLAFEIKEKHEKLAETHELNRVLLKQGLLYANRILSCFNPEKSVYGKTGNMQKTSSSGIIDKSV
jgi:flagellar biosynthesis/type III secretory pathway chaperone